MKRCAHCKTPLKLEGCKVCNKCITNAVKDICNGVKKEQKHREKCIKKICGEIL